jgi:dCTP deaminase
MSILSYTELCELVEQGVIGPVDPKAINAASIDVRLGEDIITEQYCDHRVRPVDIHKREVFPSYKQKIGKHYDLQPGEFILAHTMETFNLPNNICAEFKLKSSGARTGLENALATWCDCGWNGSTLTLELKNFLRYSALRLTPGMFIGQMIFYRVTEVPQERSYATIGRYNNDQSVQQVKL